MFKVYKITNTINDKIYFGYTSQTLYARLYGHYCEPRDTIISRSIRKYGVHNFLMEQLFLFESEVEAKAKEVELISAHKTNTLKYPQGNGMNMTDGGEGVRGYKHSPELRTRWSRERAGRKPSPESTQKRVEKIVKTVYQFNTRGDLIKQFKSVKEAGTANNTSGANISKCCRGLSITVKGFIFQYEKDFVPRQIKLGNEKCVKQYSLTGTLLNTFNSIQEAANAVHINRSGIDKCIMGRSRSAGGFKWSH